MHRDAEVVICDLQLVHSLASHVYKFKLVSIVRVLAIDRSDHLAPLVHALRKHDNFLLVLPEEDEGEGDQEEASDELTNAKALISAILRVDARRVGI